MRLVAHVSNVSAYKDCYPRGIGADEIIVNTNIISHKPHRTNISLWLFALYTPPIQKNTQNILEKLQEKVIMSKMTHLIKYKQIFYQIINENAGDVVNGTAAYVYQPDDP